jgi:hypothetical protein
MRKDILSVLQRNHRMNLFSAMNRERLADELLALVTDKSNHTSTPDNSLENDVVVKKEAFERTIPQPANLRVADDDRNRIISRTENQKKLNELESQEKENQKSLGVEKHKRKKVVKKVKRNTSKAKNILKKQNKPEKQSLPNKRARVRTKNDIAKEEGLKLQGNPQDKKEKVQKTNKANEFFTQEKSNDKQVKQINKPLKKQKRVNNKKGKMPGDPLKK